MIPASEDFITAIAGDSRNFRTSIRINSTEIDGDIQTVDVFRGTGSESILFGATYIPYFTAKIANLSTDLQDADVTLHIGVRLPNGAYSYISIGKYHITEIEEANGLLSVKGMGYAFCKMEGKNIPTSGSNSPKTLLQDIRDLCGINIYSAFSNDRLNKTVRTAIKKRTEPHSCKEVLGIVASLMGGFVTEDNSGHIVLKEYASGATIPIPADRFINAPTINKHYYEITGVKCIIHDNPKNESDPASYEMGTVNYTFRCKYMTEALFDAMADTAIGLKHYPGQFSISLGDPRIEPWDILSVADIDGTTRTVYPMQIHHHIDGGLSTEIESALSTTGDMGSGTATQTITIGSYDELLGKPSINEVILSGDQSFEDLGLYDDPVFTSKANDADVVHLAGEETITGEKTFTEPINGTASLAQAIPLAKVDSTSTDTAFTATVPGITELKDGTTVMLENGVITSAAKFTLNINGLGAKPVFNNLTAATRDTTIFNVNYTMLFVYDSNRVVDNITGAWICYRGYDSNTNTIGYQLRSNSMSLPMSDIVYRYRLLFTSADGTKFVPANSSTSTNATALRAVNQRPIDPFGDIVYYGTTASVAAGSRPSTAYLWRQNVLALGYSFNRTGAALNLVEWKAVYLKCTPQNDGSAIIDEDTPYVQTLPVTEDGKIYIFLGVAYSDTNIELIAEHPVYYFKNGSIRLWSNCTADEIVAMTGEEIVAICQ